MRSFKKKLNPWLFSLLLLMCAFVSSGFFSFTPTEPKAPINQNLIQRIKRATYFIQNYYYDSARVRPERMLQEGLYALSKSIPEVLIKFPDKSHNHLIVSVSDHTQEISFTPPQKLSDIFIPAAQVFSFVNEHYQGDTKEEDQEYAFINGMLGTLDPHSNLLTPDVFKEFKTQTEGEYGGIGTVVGIKEDELTIVAPIDGTPAMEAGLQADDKIVQIDDLSTMNMPLSEAVELLRGKVNTKVTLVIRRKTKEPFEVTLTRKNIMINSVKSKLVKQGDKNIAVLRIISFQEDTYADLEREIQALKKSAPSIQGVVLDLRNNPGGLLDQSLKIAEKFLSSGDIVYTVGANKEDEEVVRALPDPDEITAPVIVLVNEGSASASEIVAGALKGNNRALVMGSKTFGKGSVQSLFPLKDGSSLKLTIAQYLTPGRISIQAVGVTPDIQLTPARVLDDGFDLKEDETFGEKNLDEHLENKELVAEAKPLFTLKNLQTEKSEEESEYTAKINEQKDYLLSLAVKILSKTPSANRAELLKTALPLLEQEAKKQDDLLTAALKEKEIDWTIAQPTKESLSKISFDSSFFLKDSSEPVVEFHAGSEYLWKLSAKNEGEKTVSRLIGVIQSENNLLKGKEFIFGRIPVGNSKTADITIKVPKETLSFEEETSVEFFAENNVSIPPLTVATLFIEKSKPSFAYTIQLKDNGLLGSVGNGNGIPEKGETIVLDVKVINKSSNPADEVVVNIQNEEGEGILLKQGRANLGALSANGAKNTPLLFQIAPTFAKEEMKLKLSLFDKTTKANLEDTLTFPLKAGPQLSPTPPLGSLQVGPSIHMSQVIHKKDKNLYYISGTVEDDQAVNDLIIFAGGEKVFYEAAPHDKKLNKLSFEAEFPLKEGANFIGIEARDNRKITSHKILSVVGIPEKTLAQKPDQNPSPQNESHF